MKYTRVVRKSYNTTTNRMRDENQKHKYTPIENYLRALKRQDS